MSDINLVIKLKNLASAGLDKVSKGFKDVNKSVKEVNDSADKSQSTFSKLTGFIKSKLVITLGDLKNGLMAVYGSLKSVIRASNDQEDAVKTLEVAMKNAGTYTAQARQELLDYATALQANTKYADEDIVAAMARISAYGFEGDTLKALTNATLDLATAKKMDLSSASDLVAKTAGTETNALARQGITANGLAGSIERATSVTRGIATLHKGQASEAAETYSGKVENLKNKFGELFETLGDEAKRKTAGASGFIGALVDQINGFLKAGQIEDIYRETLRQRRGWELNDLKKIEDQNLSLMKIEGQRQELQIQGFIAEEKNANTKKQLEKSLKVTQDFNKEIDNEITKREKLANTQNETQKKQNDQAKKDEEAQAKKDADKKYQEDKRLEEERTRVATELKQQEEDAISLGEMQANYAMYNANKKQQIEAKFNADMLAMSQDTMASLLAIQSGGVREFFEIQKAAATADAIISGWQAIAKAATIAPYPLNIPSIAGATILAASNVNAIQSQQFADGGVIKATQGGSTGNINGVSSTVAENRSDEAIIPLEDDARLKELMGGGTTVVNLIVDGQRLAQAVVNGYNKGRNLNTVTKIKER